MTPLFVWVYIGGASYYMTKGHWFLWVVWPFDLGYMLGKYAYQSGKEFRGDKGD